MNKWKFDQLPFLSPYPTQNWGWLADNTKEHSKPPSLSLVSVEEEDESVRWRGNAYVALGGVHASTLGLVVLYGM